MDKAVAALEAGKIDGRDDTTLCWMPLHLDERGWAEIARIMEETTERVLEVQAESRRRPGHRKRGAETISAVVALASFETGSYREPGQAATPTRLSPVASRRCRARPG